MPDDHDKDDLTPVQSPEARARRASGQSSPADCPVCENDEERKKSCSFCKGHGKVTHFKRAEWELEQGKALDRCPDTERNDR
jgi:hypothetical protein